MTKEEMISSLERKIHTNRLEAKHYYDKAESVFESEPESYAVWKELDGFYSGRASAFEYALSMIEDS